MRRSYRNMAYMVKFQAFGFKGELGIKEYKVQNPYEEALKRVCSKTGCIEPVIWEIEKDGEVIYRDNRKYNFE